MIPLKHGTHFLGLLPYARLSRSPKGWYGSAGQWKAFMQERQKDEDDPITTHVLYESPGYGKGLFERYRMRLVISEETGDFCLIGLTGNGFLLGVRQVPGLWGDWCLYQCLVIPFRYRNP